MYKNQRNRSTSDSSSVIGGEYLLKGLLICVLAGFAWKTAKGQADPVVHLQVSKATIGNQEKARLQQSFHDCKIFNVEADLPEDLPLTFKMELGLNNQMNWDLQLEANDLRASGYSKYFVSKKGLERQPLETVHTYKGRVNGDSESSVRLGFYNGVVDGFIRTGSEHYFIEPLQAYLSDEKSSGKVVVYRAKDVKSTASSHCAARAIDDAEGSVRSDNPNYLDYHSRTDSCRVMQIIFVADYTYYQLYGSNASARILNVLNMAEEKFQRSLGISFEVTHQTIFQTPDGLGDPNWITIEAFKNYALPTYFGVPRNATMLFTDRRIDATDGGVPLEVLLDGAMVGVACSLDHSDRGYIIVSHAGRRSILEICEATTVAHELGHSLLMEHEYANCANGDIGCGSSSGCFGQFSAMNIGRMNFYLELGDQCLTRRIPPYEIVRGDMRYQRVPASVEVTNIGPNYALPGSRVRYVAGEGIVLRPGFHAAHGSDFEANIGEVVCAANNRMADPSKPSESGPGQRIGSPELLIIPNPTTGKVTLSVSKSDDDMEPKLTVRNQLGQQLDLHYSAFHSATEWRYETDLSSLAPGVYFTGLVGNLKSVSGKVVVATR